MRRIRQFFPKPLKYAKERQRHNHGNSGWVLSLTRLREVQETVPMVYDPSERLQLVSQT